MTLHQIRTQMTQYLQQHHIPALASFPSHPRSAIHPPVVVVSLRECQWDRAGFHSYLGEQFDPQSGCWEEIYGVRATLTFGLDLFASPKQGEDTLEALFQRLTLALSQGQPPGLCLQSISCQESSYDPQLSVMKRTAQAICLTHLQVAHHPEPLFSKIELQGEPSL